MAAADPNKSGAGGDSNNPQVETSFDDADPIRDLNANQKVKDMLQQCDKWHQSIWYLFDSFRTLGVNLHAISKSKDPAADVTGSGAASDSGKQANDKRMEMVNALKELSQILERFSPKERPAGESEAMSKGKGENMAEKNEDKAQAEAARQTEEAAKEAA